MKISRHRKVRKYLKFYKNNYQFRLPYQILIDATFCNEALKCKLNIKEQVPKYLEDPNVRLFTTPCVIQEAEMLGPKVFGAMLIVKQFRAQICGHEKNPISASECLYSMILNGNQDHYMIATQDSELSEKCRLTPGVPLLYVKYNAVHLEKPSALNTEVANEIIKANVQCPDYQVASLQKLKEEVIKDDKLEIKKTKKRKAKGPNPLSCKKKSKTSAPVAEKIKKRKRHKRGKTSNLITMDT